MLRKLFYNRTLMISLFAVLIVLSTLVALGPLMYSLIMGSGVRTEGLNADGARPATTELDGRWEVVQGSAHNFSAVGFTIDEVLPAERTTTSGSTGGVSGSVLIEGSTLRSGDITVEMASLTTDKIVRDQNMKTKLFEVEKFPQSHFVLTEPVDLAGIPDDGTVGTATLTGELTIKGVSNPVSADFDVLRSGSQIIVAGDIPINRLDYDIITPEFIAATISEEGTVNIRLSLEKAS